MKRIYFLLVLVLLCTSACAKNSPLHDSDIPLSVFIIGKWDAINVPTSDIYGNYLTDYEVEFIDGSKLSFCARTPYDSFCEKFDYQLVTGNTYSVENERTTGGHWEISRADDELIICIWTDTRCVEFTRNN